MHKNRFREPRKEARIENISTGLKVRQCDLYRLLPKIFQAVELPIEAKTEGISFHHGF